MRYTNILYFIFAAFILFFGTFLLVKGSGRLWMNMLIELIGLYFLYRGVALTVNEKHRRERETEDGRNDPANA